MYLCNGHLYRNDAIERSISLSTKKANTSSFNNVGKLFKNSNF